MPLTISVPDSLRMSVEAASGGLQTVLYTALGQPTFMNVIPKATNDQLGIAGDASIHPMFFGQDGTAKSAYFYGTYPGIVKNGELLSLPGVDPSNTLNHDQFVAYARACGAGHHVVTNAAVVGIALWCRMNSFAPRGNTNWGASSDAPWEAGRRADGFTPGTATGTGRTLTGSGPVSWRHSNNVSGISDLCGNVWEWSPGMRVLNGEINIIPTNRMVIGSVDHSVGSVEWMAIDGATGALVAPNTAGTVRFVGYTASTASTFLIQQAATFEATAVSAGSITTAATLYLLKALGVLPVASLLGGTIATPAANSDGLWLTLAGERLPIRLGAFSLGASSGLDALDLSVVRTLANNYVGGRPGFVS